MGTLVHIMTWSIEHWWVYVVIGAVFGLANLLFSNINIQ